MAGVFSWGAMHNHTILTTILASILGVIAISIGSDYMELEEPNFSALQNTIGGLLHMTVIGPLGEELCCREALLGGMLRRGVKPWIAILLSAFLFGAMHLNMSQFFGASLFGIMLAIIYYKTGNIILTSFLHILNNTVSVILNNIYGQGTTTVSLLGGDAVAIPIALISLATCIFFFWNYWKQAPHPSDTAS